MTPLHTSGFIESLRKKTLHSKQHILTRQVITNDNKVLLRSATTLKSVCNDVYLCRSTVNICTNMTNIRCFEVISHWKKCCARVYNTCPVTVSTIFKSVLSTNKKTRILPRYSIKCYYHVKGWVTILGWVKSI